MNKIILKTAIYKCNMEAEETRTNDKKLDWKIILKFTFWNFLKNLEKRSTKECYESNITNYICKFSKPLSLFEYFNLNIFNIFIWISSDACWWEESNQQFSTSKGTVPLKLCLFGSGYSVRITCMWYHIQQSPRANGDVQCRKLLVVLHMQVPERTTTPHLEST